MARESGHAEITVLLVDDDETFHRFVTPFLSEFRLLRAHNSWEGVEILAKNQVDVIILDLNLPDVAGFRVLENIRDEGDPAAVIVMSGYADRNSIQRANAWGARLVLDKTYENCRRLPWYIRSALREPIRSRKQWDLHREYHRAFARLERSMSTGVRRLVRAARHAGSTSAVLIQGEPGSDRQLIARYLHAYTEGAAGPFVATTALPEPDFTASLFGRAPWDNSLVQSADGGALFLDQVHYLDAEAQSALLRLIQHGMLTRTPGPEPRATHPDQRVHVRIIAASTADLDAAIQAGTFSPELHAALGTRLRIPPLRERTGDLADEVAELMALTAESLGLPSPILGEDVMAALLGYPFPGNDQELRAMIASACARKPGQRLTPRDILPVETE